MLHSTRKKVKKLKKKLHINEKNVQVTKVNCSTSSDESSDNSENEIHKEDLEADLTFAEFKERKRSLHKNNLIIEGTSNQYFWLNKIAQKTLNPIQTDQNVDKMAQKTSNPVKIDQKDDKIIKLMLIGNTLVGKTSFLFRFAEDSTISTFTSSLGDY